MTVIKTAIDESAFIQAHELFTKHLERNSGEHFTGWNHPFLFKDELKYKYKAYIEGRDALQFDNWGKYLTRPGQITECVKAACDERVQFNLLEPARRYGEKKCSATSVYRLTSRAQIELFESMLFEFFTAALHSPSGFAIQFDRFASHLRENHLGCNWRFVSYLAFLANWQVYFSIVPTNFRRLFRFYGISIPLEGHVSWERYAAVLELAEILRAKLALYGPATALQLQSYMWVVSYLIEGVKRKKLPEVTTPDFSRELEERKTRAGERERIGLQGEKLVFEKEIEKLANAGKLAIAGKVRLKSKEDWSVGYDILSFDIDETERHIEVKTTSRGLKNDAGFWLSDSERCVASRDPQWTLIRVTDIDTRPEMTELGNIIRNPHPDWNMKEANWFVAKNVAAPEVL